MIHSENTTIERIIGKIDNDFNPDNSDWIPRVITWTIEAMEYINVLPKKEITKKLKVINRIVHLPCPINKNDFKLYDENGCEIKEYDGLKSKQCCSFTGKDEESEENKNEIKVIGSCSPTTTIINNPNALPKPNVTATQIITKGFPYRYNVTDLGYETHLEQKYIYIDHKTLELILDVNIVYIKYNAILTTPSNIYGVNLPVVPNNEILIEAIVNYCMYKMLCRGYKHPVLNLNASQYGTNPYYMWLQLKDKAKTSIINQKQGDIIDDGGMWRAAFFNFTFNPRG